MSYIRVIPRDLFNEANLLKCLGRIYINIENLNLRDVELEHHGEAFDIRMNENDGGIYAANVLLLVRGDEYVLHRPMNSRYSWPLYLLDENGNEVEVFNDDGSFSSDMLEFLVPRI